MVIKMATKLEDLGYKVCSVSTYSVEYCKVIDDDERHYIDINFEFETIKFSINYFNGSESKYYAQDVSLEIMECAINVLKEKKVVIDYGNL